MGYSSQAGYLIARTQDSKGVYKTDTGSAGVGIKLRSGTLNPSRELLVPDAEIGGGRDVVDAYLGAASWSGDLELYARIDAITTLLRAALGTGTSATVTGVTTNTITGSDGAALPFLSIEERIGAGLEVYQYTDAIVNTFHLESDANGFLMCTAGLIAAKQVAGVAQTPQATIKYDDTPLFVGTNIGIQYGGVALPAKSFSLDINNNFEDDDFRLGSFFLGDLTPKRREITASFSLRHETSALWRQAVYGASAATSIGGLTTKQELKIDALTYEDIVGGTPLTKNSIGITIPKYMLSPFAFEPSGDDIFEGDVEGQAVRPAIATPILTVVTKTAKASIS